MELITARVNAGPCHPSELSVKSVPVGVRARRRMRPYRTTSLRQWSRLLTCLAVRPHATVHTTASTVGRSNRSMTRLAQEQRGAMIRIIGSRSSAQATVAIESGRDLGCWRPRPSTPARVSRGASIGTGYPTIEKAGFLHPCRTGHLSVAVESPPASEYRMIGCSSPGPDRGDPGANATAFNLRGVPDMDARHIDNRVSRAGVTCPVFSANLN